MTQPRKGRIAKGRREVHVWLNAEDWERMHRLGQQWGIASLRDVLATALEVAEKAGEWGGTNPIRTTPGGDE